MSTAPSLPLKLVIAGFLNMQIVINTESLSAEAEAKLFDELDLYLPEIQQSVGKIISETSQACGIGEVFITEIQLKKEN